MRVIKGFQRRDKVGRYFFSNTISALGRLLRFVQFTHSSLLLVIPEYWGVVERINYIQSKPKKIKKYSLCSRETNRLLVHIYVRSANEYAVKRFSASCAEQRVITHPFHPLSLLCSILFNRLTPTLNLTAILYFILSSNCLTSSLGWCRSLGIINTFAKQNHPLRFRHSFGKWVMHYRMILWRMHVHM